MKIRASNVTYYTFNKPILWLIFIAYLMITGYTMLHHELWGDELHSWNIVKGSTSFLNLFHNIRYEGHPPVWYMIMYPISRFTHNPAFIQAAQFGFAATVVFLFLFYSALPFTTKLLLPFGYYFMFEYAVLSRNYVTGIVAAFIICIILKKHFKYQIVVYYALLLIMSNVHLLALLLAASLHVYFLLYQFEQNKKRSNIAWHIVLGILVFLPAVYFIIPPPNSEMNAGFWINRWSVSQLAIDMQSPLRAFVPIPAWWKYNFWNTQFLIDAQSTLPLLKYVLSFVSLALILLACMILKNNKKSLVLFLCNLFATLLVGIIFPLNTERYSGFIFIGFIVACWLYAGEMPFAKRRILIINLLLIMHLAAGIFIINKDIRLPFSNAYRSQELINQVPPGEKIVTDYWALNSLSGYIDQSFYCIDLQQTLSFLIWQNNIGEVLHQPHAYSTGVSNYLDRQHSNAVYFISIKAPGLLAETDTQLSTFFQVALIEKIEGAIEKDGNLYLYKIEKLKPRF